MGLVKEEADVVVAPMTAPGEEEEEEEEEDLFIFSECNRLDAVEEAVDGLGDNFATYAP